MEEILNSMQKVEWWFEILFPIFIVFVISVLFKYLSGFLQKIARGILVRHTKKIKKIRFSSYEVQYQIVSENRYFLFFLVLCSIYIFLFTTTPFTTIVNNSVVVSLLLTFPVYIAEIAWLNKRGFIQSLIKSAKKVDKLKSSSISAPKKRKNHPLNISKKSKKKG